MTFFSTHLGLFILCFENINQVQINDILSQLTDMGENTINNVVEKNM